VALLPVRYDPPTNGYLARCPDCGLLAFFVTMEYIFIWDERVPLLVAHECEPSV
jgi:hypothetical protein